MLLEDVHRARPLTFGVVFGRGADDSPAPAVRYADVVPERAEPAPVATDPRLLCPGPVRI